MAALALTSTKPNISPVFVEQCRIRSFIASVAITAGQAFYIVTATGRAAPSNSAAANALANFRGIALHSAAAGAGFDGLEEGFVDGFEISALAFDAAVYLNDTAGILGTAAGTVSVAVGRVVPVSDRDPATGLPSKLLYVKTGLI